MLHDVIILVRFRFSSFFIKIIKITKNVLFYICFPWKGTLILTLGMGWGGTIQDPRNPKIQNEKRKISTTISNKLKNVKKILKVCFFSYCSAMLSGSHWKSNNAWKSLANYRVGRRGVKVSLPPLCPHFESFDLN